MMRKNTKRGDIWIIDLKTNIGSEQNGARPCLVLNYSGKGNTCVVIPASNTYSIWSVDVGGYLFKVDQIRVVDTIRCIRFVKRYSKEQTESVLEQLYTFLKSTPPK